MKTMKWLRESYMGELLVSVVIHMHNRREKPKHLIKPILGGDHPKDKLEIVVVGDASCPRSRHVLSVYTG